MRNVSLPRRRQLWKFKSAIVWMASIAAAVVLALFLPYQYLVSAPHFINSARFLPELLGITAVLVILGLWLLPKWQVTNSRGVSTANRFDRENEARKTLAQIVGGFFVLAGLYSSIKTFDLQRDTENLQQQGQITDRFTKAIDQLGAVAPRGGINLEVRLGGIYALERIAKDSPRDQWPIMEVLTTYVRENSKAPKVSPTPNHPDKRSPLRTDIQAILTVIGRRDVKNEPEDSILDLHEAHIEGADLLNAALNEANLIQANINGADLRFADLSGADLRFANLTGADLRFADLTGARLEWAHIERAYFEGAHLEGADLRQAYNLTNDQLAKAYGDAKTLLPIGFSPPSSWSH